MWGSKFCFAAFGCNQAFIIQTYTACQTDIWYNQHFATTTKVKQRQFWTNCAYFLNNRKYSRFLPLFKYWSGVLLLLLLLVFHCRFLIIDWIASIRLFYAFMFGIADRATGAIFCSQADSLRCCCMWFWASAYAAKASLASIQGVELQMDILTAIFNIAMYRVWVCGKTCPCALEFES